MTATPVAPANPLDFRRSPSQRACYECCPRKWYWRYYPGQRWQPRFRGIALEQGTVSHDVSHLLATQLDVKPIDPMEFLFKKLERVRENESILWGKEDSFGKFAHRMRKFWGLHIPVMLESMGAGRDPATWPALCPGGPKRITEEKFSYTVGGWKELVRPDYSGVLVLPYDVGKWKQGEIVRAGIDYKAGKYEKSSTAAELDPQLMSQQYALGTKGFTVDVMGLCVLVIQETKPRIQWLLRPAFTQHELGLFLSDALFTDDCIKAGHFPMRGRVTGECDKFSGCEYKPLCFPSLNADIAKTLYQDTRDDDPETFDLED